MHNLTHSPPSLFVDLEGDNLSRHGTISILYVHPQKHVYLIDVYKLGDATFKVSSFEGKTLKSVFESSAISKVFFDVRNDSDALYNLFGVKLANVDDLQLMELASRRFSKRIVKGLKKCTEEDSVMTSVEKERFLRTKDQGQRLFDPKAGGSYAVFNERPLSEIVQSYCVHHVLLLPELWGIYASRLARERWVSVRDASQARIKDSQSSDYNGKGQHKALSPWPGWPTSPAPSTRGSTQSHITERSQKPARGSGLFNRRR